jgi:murein DD-endopeptidase MepM/ murein hydrolase activator NlpD
MNYMQQRYYDPAIGRFLSVDPVTATSAGGNFNRYWYGNDNPYKFVDPDGRLSTVGSCQGGSILCHGGAGIGAYFSSPGPIGDLNGNDEGATGNKDSVRPDSPVSQKPIEGSVNRKHGSTANGGFDPDGSKRLRSGGARHHMGIDIGAEVGTPVSAAGDGVVHNRAEGGGKKGYGFYVDIDHGNGWVTRYAHLSQQTQAEGANVSAGAVIGLTGTSGNLPPGADPHLHFEIRLKGVPQDPTSFLDYSY